MACKRETYAWEDTDRYGSAEAYRRLGPGMALILRVIATPRAGYLWRVVASAPRADQSEVLALGEEGTALRARERAEYAANGWLGNRR